MSTQTVHAVILGYSLPWERLFKEDEIDEQTGDYDKYSFDYYHVEKNDFSQPFVFYDGRDGRFINIGIVLTAWCDYDYDSDFGNVALTVPELLELEVKLKAAVAQLPDYIQEKLVDKPMKVLAFTQLH